MELLQDEVEVVDISRVLEDVFSQGNLIAQRNLRWIIDKLMLMIILRLQALGRGGYRRRGDGHGGYEGRQTHSRKGHPVGQGFYYETSDEDPDDVEQVDESGQEDHAGTSQIRSTVRNLLMASAPGFGDNKTDEEVASAPGFGKDKTNDVIVEDATELMVGQYVVARYMGDVYIAVV